MRRYVIDIDFASDRFVRYVETFTQEHYPVFFVQKTKQWYHLGYGDKALLHSEYLDIVIDTERKQVIVDRDLKATLILYYYFHNQRLIITSDYNYFLEHIDIQKNINRDYIQLFLGAWKDLLGSLCEDIAILYPRKTYTFGSDTVDIQNKDYAPKIIGMDDILVQNFCHLTEKNRVAAEISWGKDSAFLPILAKKSHTFPFILVTGQLHSGEVGETQYNTISRVVKYLDIPDKYYEITDKDYPLSASIPWHIRHPIEEIYLPSLLGQIDILKKEWINTVFNGFGGDEVFEPKETKADIYSQDYSHLHYIFQDSFVQNLQTLLHTPWLVHIDWLFQTSVYQSLICRNNTYIHNGVWPITPYHNIDIYHFFQTMKVSKQHFFQTFYNTFDDRLQGAFDTNTNMGDFFVEFFTSDFFQNMLTSTLEHPTQLHSYYNIDEIKKTFTTHTGTIPRELLDRYDFLIYKFVYLSQMLK